GSRSRVSIVDEHHAVSDEHLVLDRYPLADERMRGDLAACADDRSLLNLDERPNLGGGSHTTSIQVHEVRVKDEDIIADEDVGSNRHVPSILFENGAGVESWCRLANILGRLPK